MSSLPCAAVRPFVHGAYTGWTERVGGTVRRREVPVPMVPLIINFGASFRIASPETAFPRAVSISSFVAGAHDSFSLVDNPDDTCCVQINLTHDAAFRLFRRPMDALHNRVVPFEDLIGSHALSLIERLGNAAGWAERFDLLDAFLTSRLMASGGLAAPVRAAMKDLAACDGRVGISRLAARVELTPKRLIQLFRRQIGIAPKTMARLHRFDAAIRSLAGQPSSLADTALAAGYYDQAHFNRDFRAFAGVTPTAYLAELTLRAGEPRLDDPGNFVQDGAA